MSNQSNHDIHLDSCIVVKDLWKEYQIVFLTKNKQPLSYVKFIKLWQSCFFMLLFENTKQLLVNAWYAANYQN